MTARFPSIATSKLASDASGKVSDSGIGAAEITLGDDLSAITRAVHCNVAGSAILTFASKDAVEVVFLAGVTYPFAITKAATAGGTDPTLVAIF